MGGRRELLRAGAVALGGALAGCTGLLSDDTIEASASPATVSTEALDATGYERDEIEESVVTRTYDVYRVDREVRATNRYAEYDREIDLGPFGTYRANKFTAATTPEVDVAGRALNPVADASNRDLAERVQRRYENLRVGERDFRDEIAFLGTETGLNRYDAELRMQDGDLTVDAYLYVVDAVESDGDYAFCVAVHPVAVEGEPAVRTLVRNVEHPSG